MADTTKIIDKFSYDGVTYVLQDNNSGYITSSSIPTNVSAFTNDAGYITSDTQVTSTAVTAATTNYIVGSTSSSTDTGTLSKHASAVLYTTANSGTSGYTQLRLGNTTATSSAGGKEGQIRLYGTNATYYLDLKPGAIASSNKTITFPNATGTVALTSDIPTVPSAGTSAQSVGTSNSGGSATTWSKSDHVHAISSSTITTALGFTPSSTDNKVAQNDCSEDHEYRLLFSNSANDNNETATAQKSVYFRCNPSIPRLQIGSHVEHGSIIYYSQAGVDNTANGISLDSHSATSYSSAWTPGTFRLQHWNESKGSGGSITPANFVDTMTYIGTAGVQVTSYNDLNSVTKHLELDSNRLIIGNTLDWSTITSGVSIVGDQGQINLRLNSSSSKTITPTKIDTWDDHVTNNSSVTAQTTQAVYPIKIDSKGHISAYGNKIDNIVQTTATQTLTNKTYTTASNAVLTFTNSLGNLKMQGFSGTWSFAANGTQTLTLTAAHVYLMILKRMNNSNAGGVYIIAPHGTTGSVTALHNAGNITVSQSKLVTTFTNSSSSSLSNMYYRVFDLG